MAQCKYCGATDKLAKKKPDMCLRTPCLLRFIQETK